MSSQLINRVVELTNAERAKAGLKPLTLNNQLTEAAQGHSDSMAADDFFSHTGADGSTIGDRVQEEGYEFARTGENIAAGQTTAEQVVEGWMNSPGHRANILNADYTEIGIGYELLENDTGSVNYNHYWTQVFGKPLNDNSQISNDVPNPTIEQNNSIDPVAVEDNSSNDSIEETPDIPVFEQQSSNSDTSKPEIAPVNEVEAPLAEELTPVETTPTVEQEDPSNDNLDVNQLEMEMGDSTTPEVEEVNAPEIAPVDEAEAPLAEESTSVETTPTVEQEDPSNDNLDVNQLEMEMGDSTTPEVEEVNAPEIAPVDEAEAPEAEELTPVETTPTVETEDSLTESPDVNLFGMEMGDSTLEVEEVNEDLTGGSSNITLTGGDDMMTSASSKSFSYSVSFSSSDYSIEDVSEMLNKSWLGTSEFDLSNYQSEMVEKLADSNFSWDCQQQIAESLKSFF